MSITCKFETYCECCGKATIVESLKTCVKCDKEICLSCAEYETDKELVICSDCREKMID